MEVLPQTPAVATTTLALLLSMAHGALHVESRIMQLTPIAEVSAEVEDRPGLHPKPIVFEVVKHQVRKQTHPAKDVGCEEASQP